MQDQAVYYATNDFTSISTGSIFPLKIKPKTQGEIEWLKTFEIMSARNEGYEVLQTEDEGFLKLKLMT
jgi:hypothetical protein